MSEIMDRLVEKRVQEAVNKAVHECSVKTAKKLIALEKLSLEEIAEYSGLSVEEVRELSEERENDEHKISWSRYLLLQF